MNVLPTCQQCGLILGYDPHGSAYFAAGHAVSPDYCGSTVGAEVDLGLNVTEDVDMSRSVIVDEDDHAQAMGTRHGDHRAI